jgi:hypothetical protein
MESMNGETETKRKIRDPMVGSRLYYYYFFFFVVGFLWGWESIQNEWEGNEDDEKQEFFFFFAYCFCPL